MAWTDELYNIFEYNSNRKFAPDEIPMSPVSHLKTQIVLEVILSENSDFITADVIDPKDAYTIIPVTGASKTRKPVPYGLTDGLQYLAGDLPAYMPAEEKKVKGKITSIPYNNTEHHLLYTNQLGRWATGPSSHKSVRIINEYITKKSLTADLINAGVLVLDDNGKLLPKQYKRDVEKINVRFAIDYSDPDLEKRTWMDKSLYESFIDFNKARYHDNQLCYASGKYLPVQLYHPNQIIRASTYAKLISANDDENFTFKGRFHDREEILSVSYEYSEKIHNALKWLIETRGIYFGTDKENTMLLVIWASNIKDLPDIRKTLLSGMTTTDPDADPDSDITAPTIPEYHKLLKERMLGYGKAFDINDKVMIISLDCATQGRTAMTMYTELSASQYLTNIEKWHRDTAVKRLYGKTYDSIGIIEIAEFAYGHELEKKIECKPKIKETAIMRLILCMTENKPVPHDILSNICEKASDPNLYQSESNFQRVNEIALGLIRRDYIYRNNCDNAEGDILMAYDPNLNDRSYLFGCLLAIAHKLEYSTYDERDKQKRQTNAKRFRRTFSKRPAESWQRINERLDPYMRKLSTGARIYYEKLMNDITGKMPESYFTNAPLSPLYIAGYHHFMQYMYTPKTDSNNPDNSDPNTNSDDPVNNTSDTTDNNTTDVSEGTKNDIPEETESISDACDAVKEETADTNTKKKKSDKKSKDKSKDKSKREKSDKKSNKKSKK